MSKLFAPGGWVHSTRVPGCDVFGARCAFCGHTITGSGGWVLVLEESVACETCLPDPSAQRGLAGRRALYRLRNRLDRERKQQRKQPPGEWWEIR